MPWHMRFQLLEQSGNRRSLNFDHFNNPRAQGLDGPIVGPAIEFHKVFDLLGRNGLNFPLDKPVDRFLARRSRF